MRVLRLVTVLTAAALAPASLIVAHQAARGIRLANLTWPEAAAILKPETVVVIPLGAGSKEHGPHLKLNNDAVIADYLTRRVLDASDVVVAPALPYHFYPAFVEYPGSTTLTLETARALTTEVAVSLARFGPRRFYVLNTGISTSRAIDPAVRALAAQGILLGYTDLAPRLERASAAVRQEEGGTHADEVETSMMLFIDPDGVDMRRAVKEYTPSPGALRLTRTRGGPGTFSESGVWGDPTLATKEKGRVIVEALVVGILEDIEAIRRAPLPSPSALAPPGASTASAPARDRARRQSSRLLQRATNGRSAHWVTPSRCTGRMPMRNSLAALWSEEGDMVHPDGRIERGRESNQDQPRLSVRAARVSWVEASAHAREHPLPERRRRRGRRKVGTARRVRLGGEPAANLRGAGDARRAAQRRSVADRGVPIHAEAGGHADADLAETAGVHRRAALTKRPSRSANAGHYLQSISAW